MLSRREILTLLLGAPAAAWACQRQPARKYDGRIVGGSQSFGHQILRDIQVPATNDVEHVEIAIVGSGIAGLSAAWRLERRGEPRFVVLELESKAGGTSCYEDAGVVPHPWAAHYIPVPDSGNSDLVALLQEIGALEPDQSGGLQPTEGMVVRAPEERLFINGRWSSGLLPRARMNNDDWQEFHRFQRYVEKWVAFRDSEGHRAFTLPLNRCSAKSPWIKDDAISASEWLSREGFHSPPLRFWLEYGCRDDYGCSLKSTSAWAFMLYHAARVPAPGLPSSPYLTWPEGNGRLVRHFESLVGQRLRRQQLVSRVEQKDDCVELSVVRNGATPYKIRARHVVLAVPQFIVRRLMSSSEPPEATSAALFTYAPWLVANLHLKARPRVVGFPLAWDNVLFDSPSLGYVVATHQLLNDDGPTVLTYYLPFTDTIASVARQELSHLEHSRCCDVIMADLGRAHPDLPELVTRIDIWRWGHAMIRPIPGLIWGGALADAQKPQGRIHFAHTDLSGVALFEEAHAHGVRAADAILKARGTSSDVG